MGVFLDDLRDLASATITVAPFVSADKNNQASYGTAVSYAAYVAGPVKYAHRLSATERISSQTLYIFSPNAVSAKDQITMPVGYDSSVMTPLVAQVDRVEDELGFCFTVIYFG